MLSPAATRLHLVLNAGASFVLTPQSYPVSNPAFIYHNTKERTVEADIEYVT